MPNITLLYRYNCAVRRRVWKTKVVCRLHRRYQSHPVHLKITNRMKNGKFSRIFISHPLILIIVSFSISSESKGPAKNWTLTLISQPPRFKFVWPTGAVCPAASIIATPLTIWDDSLPRNFTHILTFTDSNSRIYSWFLIVPFHYSQCSSAIHGSDVFVTHHVPQQRIGRRRPDNRKCWSAERSDYATFEVNTSG